MNKKIIIIIIVIVITAILVWAWIASNQPLPGEQVKDLGREHVEIGKEVSYNSNPPTSGSHYVDWVKAGVYAEPKDDKNLVHSLEHGYVILSYSCNLKFKIQNSKFKNVVSNTYAHGLEEEGSPSANEATPSADAIASSQLTNEFRTDECHNLVDNLIAVYEKKGKRKLIITPRPSLDSKIALTAWGRVDKFNSFDRQRVEKFIDAYRDHGPEQTME